MGKQLGNDIDIMSERNPIVGTVVIEPESQDRQPGKRANGRRKGPDTSIDQELFVDYAGQVAAIRKSQAVIEFDMQGNILDANQNFLDAVGYRLDEIKGRHHSMFAEESYRQSSEYREFWAKLNRGEYQAREFKGVGKGGKEVYTQASYNPILDAHGKPFKVVEYATDITRQKEALHNMMADAAMLVEAALAGQLDTRADLSKHEGDYRMIVEGFNQTLDAVIGPLNVAAEYVDKISRGEIPARITEEYNGDFNAIKSNLNNCIDNINSLVADAGALTDAAVAQKFETRANAGRHVGDFRRIVEGVNKTLDVVVDKLAWYQAIVDAVPFPIHVIDKDMKWVFLNKAFEKLMVGQGYVRDREDAVGRPCSTAGANICNTEKCGIAQLKRGVPESFFDWCGMSCKQDTSHLIDIRGEKVGFVEVVQDLSATLGVKDYTAREVERVASHLVQLSRGDLNFELHTHDADKYTQEVKQQFDKINDTLEQVKRAVGAMAADAVMLSKAAVKGRLATRADAAKHNGDYRSIVEGVNQTLDSVVGPMNFCAQYLGRIAKGDIPPRITDTFQGDFNGIKDNLNNCIDNINALVADAIMLAKAAVDGQLSTRADATKHQGDYRKIVEGVNQTLDAVVAPVQEAAEVIEKIAGQDLTVRVNGNYRGDHAAIKDNINHMVTDLRNSMQQIAQSAGILASSAEELTATSQQMAGNAEETATQANVVSAAAEQVSKNVSVVATGAEQMQSSIREIAKSSNEAAKVAKNAVRAADCTNQTIGKLGESSIEIGKVIKVITSIAQQTNLLALNATIEAARAGEAGKGFAVVANEVKELAKETAKATEDIGQKIEAIQTDTKGAVQAIGEIGTVINQINDISNTIASAVEEQTVTTNEIGRNVSEAARGTSDIAKNISGVAQAAQNTTQGASDSQKAAAALASMAAQLQSVVSKFKV